jgi:hypothetical protein
LAQGHLYLARLVPEPDGYLARVLDPCGCHWYGGNPGVCHGISTRSISLNIILYIVMVFQCVLQVSYVLYNSTYILASMPLIDAWLAKEHLRMGLLSCFLLPTEYS